MLSIPTSTLSLVKLRMAGGHAGGPAGRTRSPASAGARRYEARVDDLLHAADILARRRPAVEAEQAVDLRLIEHPRRRCGIGGRRIGRHLPRCGSAFLAPGCRDHSLYQDFNEQHVLHFDWRQRDVGAGDQLLAQTIGAGGALQILRSHLPQIGLEQVLQPAACRRSLPGGPAGWGSGSALSVSHSVGASGRCSGWRPSPADRRRPAVASSACWFMPSSFGRMPLNQPPAPAAASAAGTASNNSSQRRPAAGFADSSSVT